MRRVLTLLVLILSSMASAQQPNQPGATLQIDGQNGPPWPVPFTWRTAVSETVTLSGQPNAPFLLAAAPQLCPGCINAFGGTFDLDPLTAAIIADGLTQPGTFFLDTAGSWGVSLVLPQSMPPGSTAGIQALVQDLGSPSGLSFSAAWDISVTQGPTIINLPLADNSFFPVMLPAGMVFPFYDTDYTTIYVNSNGSISFTNGDTDFTPTPAEFLSGVPKVAGYWADISPQAGGTVRVIFDTVPYPKVRVEFDQVPDRPNLAGVVFGAPHTFYMEVVAVTGAGDLDLIYTPFTFPSVVPTICGISPGFGLDASPQKDLSQIVLSGGQTGGFYESFYEWFGQTNMPGYTPTQNNFFDLDTFTLSFTGVSLGTPNPRYNLN